ncbi:glycosyltransferase [Calothrix membranacea FACHB-236]|nr:glycosyltransferase [Calothrix membranacea FACHB-236]
MNATVCISIIIPSYNQAPWLEACLESILKQNYPNLEVIIIDGGSTDNSVDVIKRYAHHLTYWVSERDRGQSHALNKGFAKASGNWITWLNSDDLLLPGSLISLQQHIIAYPDVQWWIGNGWFIDSQGKNLKIFKSPKGISQPKDLCPWTENWLPQPGSFFTSQLLEKTGAYLREDLHYAMDLELWLRFLQYTKPRIIDYDMAAYRLHNQSKTVSMMPSVEAEIVKVFAEHLGLEKALERVKWLAGDRYFYEERYQELIIKLKPFIKVVSMFKYIKHNKHKLHKI